MKTILQDLRTGIAVLTLATMAVGIGWVGADRAHAQSEDETQNEGQRPPRGGPRGGPRGLPPELEEKLTDEQKAQLKAASSREEKMQLLKSWGIEMPKPPGRGGPRGEPPSQGQAPSQELNNLMTSVLEARSDSELEIAREALRSYYKTSTDEGVREAIRHYFQRNPSSVSGVSYQATSGSASGSIAK